MTSNNHEVIKDIFLLDKGNLLVSKVDLIGVKTSGSKKALIKEEIKLIKEDVIREGDTFLFFEVQPIANLNSFPISLNSRIKLILLGGHKFYNVEATPKDLQKYFSLVKTSKPKKSKYNMNALPEEVKKMFGKLK